jgi:hypothetical protein
MNLCIVAGLREEVIVLEEFSVGRRGFCLWCSWFGVQLTVRRRRGVEVC